MYLNSRASSRSLLDNARGRWQSASRGSCAPPVEEPMTPVLLVLLNTPAHAGYGDLDAEGNPTWAAREVHLWTNAARVDPEAFEADYNAGGCSFDDFSGDEQTPKAPLYFDSALNAAAEFHTNDMVESGQFSHDSSDGTSFAARLAQYYSDSGYVGENIAYGYGGGYNTIFRGWMCSTAGHRANIMSGDYNELGTGAQNDYYTQDFGAGTVSTDSPIAMAVHSPEAPTSSVSVYADWQGDLGPTDLKLVLDGAATPLSLAWGEPEQGLYVADADLDSGVDCHQYYVAWTASDGASGAYPEEGSMTFGDACEDGIGWIPSQQCITGENCPISSADELEGDIDLVGCASAPGRGTATLTLLALALLGFRRR